MPIKRDCFGDSQALHDDEATCVTEGVTLVVVSTNKVNRGVFIGFEQSFEPEGLVIRRRDYVEKCERSLPAIAVPAHVS